MKVMIFGTFDDFHPGHQFLLTEASKRGDLCVVVARDANVERIKGHSTLQSEDVRKEVIEGRFPEANVILGDPDNFLTAIREVKPDLILFGYDQNLPPGISEADIGVPIERLSSFEPHIHKSSIRRAGKKD